MKAVMKAAADDREVLKVEEEEAAALMRVTKNTAYELIAKGEIPSVRLGRLIRVPRRALLAMLEGKGGDASA
jgi:excisionase family DNA binding protein